MKECLLQSKRFTWHLYGKKPSEKLLYYKMFKGSKTKSLSSVMLLHSKNKIKSGNINFHISGRVKHTSLLDDHY